jgi:NAD(P)H-nitrite reductase large subunit
LLRARRRHLLVRPFLDTLYRVPDNALQPPDETLVCRCEEIDAATLRAAATIATGPNQVKAFTRCGMGPCQGRSCGPALEQICARTRGLEPGRVERLRVRPPLKPITLGMLADAVEEET